MPWPKGQPHRPEMVAKRIASFIAGGGKRKRSINGLWLCISCSQCLPSEAFYSDARNTNGLKSECKRCHCKTAIATRDPEKARLAARESMRRSRMKDPEKFRARDREASRFRPRDERVRARQALNEAVRIGAVVRPRDCSRCGTICRVQAHHHDYSLPLAVVWLCAVCHAVEHAARRVTPA